MLPVVYVQVTHTVDEFCLSGWLQAGCAEGRCARPARGGAGGAVGVVGRRRRRDQGAWRVGFADGVRGSGCAHAPGEPPQRVTDSAGGRPCRVTGAERAATPPGPLHPPLQTRHTRVGPNSLSFPQRCRSSARHKRSGRAGGCNRTAHPVSPRTGRRWVVSRRWAWAATTGGDVLHRQEKLEGFTPLRGADPSNVSCPLRASWIACASAWPPASPRRRGRRWFDQLRWSAARRVSSSDVQVGPIRPCASTRVRSER
jgi:hypothetical protein